MLREFRFFLSLVGYQLRASATDRRAFGLQLSFMMLNNFIYCVTWLLFFARFEEVRGWRLEDMLALYGLVAIGFGSSIVFAGGLRLLSEMVRDGGLDTILTQPRSVVLQVAGSRTVSAGWGDLVSGMLLVVASGYTDPSRWPILVCATLTGFSIFAATALLVNTLAFWFGSLTDMARQFLIFLVTFSVYPQHIFSGAMKFVLFTIFPAGFIGLVPVRLLREPNYPELLILVAAAAGYSSLAILLFRRGLRRYESGNLFVSNRV